MRAVMLVSALALVAAAGFCQRAKTPEELVVGEWREQGEDSYVEFRPDKTVSMGGKALGLKLEITGTYAFIEPDRIKIESNGLAALAGPMTFTIAFPADNTMTMKNEATGKTRTYAKSASP